MAATVLENFTWLLCIVLSHPLVHVLKFNSTSQLQLLSCPRPCVSAASPSVSHQHRSTAAIASRDLRICGLHCGQLHAVEDYVVPCYVSDWGWP